jgi:hypothetical protein
MLYNRASLSRRDLLKLSAAAVSAGCFSGWLNVLAARAAQAPAAQQARHKRCVLLWMNGGPSHKDTFDPKPGTDNSGPFRPIATSVPGVQISELFPRFAQQMQHAAILRGMSTLEGAHPRAQYHLHTGYREGQGGVVYPSIGALVAKEIGNPDFALPNFVSVGGRSFGSGFLGPRHQPLVINDPTRGVENLRPLVDGTQFESRVGLLDEMEQGFYRTFHSEAGTSHQTTYRRAVQLMQSREARAFDLSQETAATRTAYGDTRFGDSCLLARRLIETGVSFVEVTLGGWDTHQNNNTRVRQLCAQVDPAMSSLVSDLQQRGLLNDTLVVWMGEFGRTPRMNQRGAQPGRDHYPRAWSTVLVGGGIRGGQVIGRTDAEGATVVDGRVSAIDFMATICRALGIDYNRMNTTGNGRPIRIVERGATPVAGLFS